MNTDDLVKNANRIIKSTKTENAMSMFAEAKEFLRIYAGEKSAFFKQLESFSPREFPSDISSAIQETLEAFISYVENGLLEGVSIERKAQIDVVSDFLDQANTLLNSNGVHSAAPASIIGAALEEFLRNWVEEADLSIGGKKPGLDSYTKVLREAKLITRQDVKDITSWSGLRNHAAHGQWNEVEDKSRISIMLEGVNLFMRKYGERGV